MYYNYLQLHDIIYNFLAFLGLGGFQLTGVLSVMEMIFNPLICKPLMADMRPGPNPRTRTLTVFQPRSSAF